LECDSVKAYGIRVNIAVYITTNCQFLLVKMKLTVCSPREQKKIEAIKKTNRSYYVREEIIHINLRLVTVIISPLQKILT
jgi:hypothetical protein